MDKLAWGLFRAVRPKQWIKNFALFAGLVFYGKLDDPASLWVIIQAFVIFCGLSSATYLLNDVFDIERDKKHPFKSKRPIASGIVPIWLAIAVAFGLIFILLPLSYLLAQSVFYAALAYLILQLFYSAYLKSVILLDVIVIAAGFVLRVYAGIWAIGAHLNVWFLLSIISFSLFIAIGKRRSELTLMSSKASEHRETLEHYPPALLDILTAMFANSTWLTYALFVFQQPPINLIRSPLFVEFFVNRNLPYTEAKFLMTTVPVVIYGVMRYLYIIYEKKEGESPERVILTDRPLLVAVMLWLVMVVFIIYYV